MKIRLLGNKHRVEFISACNKVSTIRVLDGEGKPIPNGIMRVPSEELSVPRDQQKGSLMQKQGTVLWHDSLVIQKKQASRVGRSATTDLINSDGAEERERKRKAEKELAIRKAKQAKAWKTGRGAK